MRDNYLKTGKGVISGCGGFVVFSLPRSRTTWLSRFLSYGDWTCGHDELQHMRSLDDVKTWFTQPFTGTVETAAAPFWRLLPPDCKVAVVRRPVDEVVDSFMAIPGVTFDREALTEQMNRHDRKLDQIEARLPCLSVDYRDCASLFEYCLGLPFDPAWHELLAPVNMQVDMRALVKYCEAFGPALFKLASVAKQRMLANLALKPAVMEGVTIQCEDFDTWINDAQALFDEHLVMVGEAPGDWQRKNIPLMRALYEMGAMQITTARSNGRMFGYLMTLISPSLAREGLTTATNTTFFADENFPGLGMKLQRAALRELQAKGVGEVFWEAGNRGTGPRLGTMYRRLGGVEHSQTYRLALEAA